MWLLLESPILTARACTIYKLEKSYWLCVEETRAMLTRMLERLAWIKHTHISHASVRGHCHLTIHTSLARTGWKFQDSLKHIFLDLSLSDAGQKSTTVSTFIFVLFVSLKTTFKILLLSWKVVTTLTHKRLYTEQYVKVVTCSGPSFITGVTF